MPSPETAITCRAISWELLVRYEPRLADLKKRANRAAMQRDGREERYQFYKKALEHLVVFDRIGNGPNFLFSRSGYDIAHREILGKW